MRQLLIGSTVVALLLASFARADITAQTAALQTAAAPSAATQAGDPAAGKALWQGNINSCKNCHGVDGEGGFGPTLAGRNLTGDQIRKAMRTPVWLMPSFETSQVSDQEADNFATWLASLPAVATPGKWRFEVPPNAPRGQVLALKNVGCGQCHNPDLETPRHSAGAVNGDFEWFKTNVYNHTTAIKEFWKVLEIKGTPRVRMGNYSPMRLKESTLQEIWAWAHDDLGLLVPLNAGFTQGEVTPEGVTYTLTIENMGARGKGLAAQNATVTLVLPSGATVVKATGDGYKGVHRDEEAHADAVVWQAPLIAAKDRLQYTLTLSKPGTKEDNLHGSVQWTTQGSGKSDDMPLRVGQRPRDIP